MSGTAKDITTEPWTRSLILLTRHTGVRHHPVSVPSQRGHFLTPSLIVRTVIVDAKLGSVLLYVHTNRRLVRDREPRTATSTFTQLLSSGLKKH